MNQMYKSLNQESIPLSHTLSQRSLLFAMLLSNRKERAGKALIVLFSECYHVLITSITPFQRII